MRGGIPVSYTHLDVYKRQGFQLSENKVFKERNLILWKHLGKRYDRINYLFVRRDYVSLYEKLIDRKKSGEKLKFDDLSEKEFKQLYIDEKKSDSILAELFDEKKSKITYRRKKLGITMRLSLIHI